MQKYNIASFLGEYKREFVSPNTFIQQDTGNKLILRTRTTVLPNQTKHYLVYKLPNDKRANYFSALWGSSNNTGDSFEYIVTDTQRNKAKCIISSTSIRIEVL